VAVAAERPTSTSTARGEHGLNETQSGIQAMS